MVISDTFLPQENGNKVVLNLIELTPILSNCFLIHELVELGLELGLNHSNKVPFTFPKSGNENTAWSKEIGILLEVGRDELKLSWPHQTPEVLSNCVQVM